MGVLLVYWRDDCDGRRGRGKGKGKGGLESEKKTDGEGEGFGFLCVLVSLRNIICSATQNVPFVCFRVG